MTPGAVFRPRVFTALLIALTAACGTSLDNSVSADTSRNKAAPLPAVSRSFAIRMDRGGGGFRSPSYSVSIESDGRVIYQGRDHVAAAGERRGQANPGALARLKDRIQGARALDYASAYVHGKPGCGGFRTDQPVVTLEFTLDGRTKRIRHDLGCEDAPPALTEIENLVDAAAGTSEWVRGIAEQ